MPERHNPTLVRAIGRWSLAALTVNCIIGSGVFGLPSVMAGSLNSASPFAWIFAAAANLVIMACFAEVSSRFEQSGGMYLYSRVAFGRTAGIGVAWFAWLGRLTASAANANLFVIYLAEFWPAAGNPIPRVVVLTVLIGILTLVNYTGVRHGTTQSNVFTAAKLTTLAVFIFAGFVFLFYGHHSLVVAIPEGPAGKWLSPVLLLMFAYGGYETALTPGAEARNPRRDYPFALFVALITCTVVYTAAQLIVDSLLAHPAASDRPIAAAARVVAGGWGAALVSVGVLVSTYGYLSANILGAPRIFFAMAEQGDLPPVVATVHPRFRTPHVAILIFALLVCVFSVIGSFRWNVFISAVSRLIYYGSVCAALPVLRRKPGVPSEHFHLRGGDWLALVAIAISLLLFPRLDRSGLVVTAVLAIMIAANTLWAARQGPNSVEVSTSEGTEN